MKKLILAIHKFFNIPSYQVSFEEGILYFNGIFGPRTEPFFIYLYASPYGNIKTKAKYMGSSQDIPEEKLRSMISMSDEEAIEKAKAIYRSRWSWLFH